MYEAFFGMTHTPFTRDLPPECLYETKAMSDVLGRLMYVADKKLFAVITSVHIAKLIGRVCEAKRPHSVSERPARALS